MQGADFRTIRESFGLSVMQWCLVLGYDNPKPGTKRTIISYESGKKEIPGYIESLVIMYERFGIPSDFLEDAGINKKDK